MLAQLVSLGFDMKQAKQAWDTFKDLNLAAEWLLSTKTKAKNSKNHKRQPKHHLK
jgi:hypothetical protein